ncbi:MAG: hypothetical protein ACE5F1_21450 [Planctomycetota bacterium]
MAYTVQWAVLSGELHGFYFRSEDRLRIGMAADTAYALDQNGRRYGLSITPLGGRKWDIVLAGGAGVSSGTVTYFFAFETDFARAGYLAPATSPAGKRLCVFNWSPVQWDEAREHYTLKVLLPHELGAGAGPRRYVEENQLVLTERFASEEYRIDYQRGEGGRLRLLFYKERHGNKFEMRTQFYVPAEWFSLAERPRRRVSGRQASRGPSSGRTWLFMLGGSCCFAASSSWSPASTARW